MAGTGERDEGDGDTTCARSMGEPTRVESTPFEYGPDSTYSGVVLTNAAEFLSKTYPLQVESW